VKRRGKRQPEMEQLPLLDFAAPCEPPNMVLRSPNGNREIEVNATPEAAQLWIAAGWRVVSEITQELV
jgi:hypothetical protein